MSDDLEKNLWDSTAPKVKLIGGFAKHCIDHEKQRAELRKFVETMVEGLKQQEDAEKDIESRYKFRVRKFSLLPRQKSRTTDKEIEFTFTKEGHDEFCFTCEEDFESSSKDIYSCRVCTRAFHRGCILSDKQCSQVDKDCIDRCHTNTGWSCSDCANLPLLLTQEEMDSLVVAFDEIDSNHDSFISLEEYMDYKTRTVHLASTETARQQLTLQFKTINMDKDGLLKYWDFVNHEAKLLIAKRPTDVLIDMLTEKELVHAKAVFTRMDDDNDGLVTHRKAMMAYKDWYSKVGAHGGDESSLDLHADVAAKMVMDHDTTNTGTVTWADFLAGQAIYIICGRPNV